jgi:hypothetical protein
MPLLYNVHSFQLYVFFVEFFWLRGVVQDGVLVVNFISLVRLELPTARFDIQAREQRNEFSAHNFSRISRTKKNERTALEFSIRYYTTKFN